MARKRTTPAKPAMVSGPGELSQRTDGGPGSAKQPIRVPTGGSYGQAQALEGQQQAAPLPAVSPGSAQAPPAAAPQAAGPMPDVDSLFAPTAMSGPGGPVRDPRQFVAEDPNMLLKAIYQKFPHPEIARLMRALQ